MKAPSRPLAPLCNPPRKGKYGHKQLTLNSDAIRSCVFPHHRRAVRNQEKRDRVRKRRLERHERLAAQARVDFRHLRKEAETTMQQDMTDEDEIFLKQLQELQLDQVLQHDLEACRDRVVRAADAAAERQQGFEVRDEVVAMLWSPEQDHAAEQAWKKKVEAFVGDKTEKELKREAARRRREDAAMRADEARRRAHEQEERRLREKQERLFREEVARKAREEARERQLQEEMERQRREAQERRLREEQERLAKAEQERQARLLAEQARRAAQTTDEQSLHHFAVYEAKWHELRTSTSLPPIDVSQMPWPVFNVISSPEQITYQEIKAFVFHPLRPVPEGKSARDKVKAEVLRFHPDKFNIRIAPKIQPSQQQIAREIAGAVARILTKLMTEVEKAS